MKSTVSSLLAMVTLTACGGFRVGARITAETARYPVSLTGTVLNTDFTAVPRRDLQRLGAFSFDRSICGANVPVDLSSAVNDAVDLRAGEAVVDLRFDIAPGASDDSGCGRLRAYGEVVRRRHDRVALDELTRGCEHGRADLCLGLAARLAHGVGVARDPARTVEALSRGCDRGSMVCCVGLGGRLAEGDGVTRDIPRATGAVRRACDAGVSEGCVWQAVFLSHADNPQRDIAQARSLAARLCQRGSMHGCYVEADLTLAEAPDDRRDAAARRLFERACVGGYAQGCARGAAMMREGRGGPTDEARAAALEGAARRAGPATVTPPTGTPAAPWAVAGLLSPEAIRGVVVSQLATVNACHEAGLARDPSARGRVVVRFVIAGDGAVAGSGVASSTYPIASVGECIAHAVRTWRFPPPTGGGVVTVNYPFNLTPPGESR